MTYIPDIYSGVNLVLAGTTLMITEYSQMINYGGLTIDGVLVIQGDLILK